MATIGFNKDYNYWDILVNLGIQPSEKEKYSYSIDGDKSYLTIDSKSKSELEEGLNKYDHQKFLDNLPKKQISDKQHIEKLQEEKQELQLKVEALSGQTQFLEDALTELILAVLE